MDPVLIGGAVALVLGIAVLTFLVRGAKKRGEAEAQVEVLGNTQESLENVIRVLQEDVSDEEKWLQTQAARKADDEELRADRTERLATRLPKHTVAALRALRKE